MVQFYWTFIVIFGSILPRIVFSQSLVEPERKSRMIVDFRTSTDSEAWLAKALEQNVFDILSGFPRIQPIPKEKVNWSECSREDMACRIALFSKVEVEAYFYGEIEEDFVAYQLFDTRRQIRIDTGRLAFQDTSAEKMKVIVFAAMKPFLQKGGIFDQNESAPLWQESPQVKEPFTLSYFWQNLIVQASGLFKIIVFVIAMTYLILPLLIGFPFAINSPGQKKKLRSMLIWFGSTCLACVLLSLSFLIEILELQELFLDYRWTWMILSGTLWGLWLILHIDLLFSRNYEFEKMDAHTLPSLFRAWSIIVFGRILVMSLIYGPIVLLGLFAAALFEIPRDLAYFLFLPALGIAAYIGLLSWLEMIAAFIDRKHQYHQDDAKRLQDYVTEYLIRFEIDLSQINLDRIVFMEGSEPDLKSYGGGFLNTRLVIHSTLIQEAFSEDKEAADFLFGAILRELGHIYRYQHLYLTLFIGANKVATSIPGIKFVWKFVIEILKRYWSKYPALIADGFVAANQGLHHILQFYHLKQGGSLKTHRANWDRLREASLKVYRYAQDTWDEGDRFSKLSTAKHRIIWLAEIWLPNFAGKRAKSKTGRLTLWSVVFVFLVWFSMYLYESYTYHPIYNDRIEILKKEIEDKKRKLKKETTT